MIYSQRKLSQVKKQLAELQNAHKDAMKKISVSVTERMARCNQIPLRFQNKAAPPVHKQPNTNTADNKPTENKQQTPPADKTQPNTTMQKTNQLKHNSRQQPSRTIH